MEGKRTPAGRNQQQNCIDRRGCPGMSEPGPGLWVSHELPVFGDVEGNLEDEK